MSHPVGLPGRRSHLDEDGWYRGLRGSSIPANSTLHATYCSFPSSVLPAPSVVKSRRTQCRTWRRHDLGFLERLLTRGENGRSPVYADHPPCHPSGWMTTGNPDKANPRARNAPHCLQYPSLFVPTEAGAEPFLTSGTPSGGAEFFLARRSTLKAYEGGSNSGRSRLPNRLRALVRPWRAAGSLRRSGRKPLQDSEHRAAHAKGCDAFPSHLMTEQSKTSVCDDFPLARSPHGLRFALGVHRLPRPESPRVSSKVC